MYFDWMDVRAGGYFSVVDPGIMLSKKGEHRPRHFFVIAPSFKALHLQFHQKKNSITGYPYYHAEPHKQLHISPPIQRRITVAH
jgi:hypothetical protein